MKKLSLVLVLASVMLGGCGGGGVSSQSTTSSSAASSETAISVPSPTAPPAPRVAVGTIYCGDDDTPFSDYHSAWPGKYKDCEGDQLDGDVSPLDTQAAQIAYGQAPDEGALTALYGLCATNNIRGFDYLRTAGSKAQVREIEGMLTLCPDHPLKKQLKQLIGGANADNDLQAQGKIFYDGTYRVGKDVPPGNYFSEPEGDGCYWERTDSKGNILANNYSSGARVEVTVRSSDYSLTVRGCGEWRPVS